MKLAIIGAGIIGTTIGRRWTQSGHEVIYGARDPDGERYRDLRAESSVLPLSEAIGTADAILIATPGDAIENLLDTQADHLNGRLLMDATNRMGGDRLHQIALFEERVPTARVYRAFNTLGWENFAEPVIDGERVDLFYSGPQSDDRTTVERLTSDVGLRPVYVGAGVGGADLLDGITRLWFALALGNRHGRHVAFRTLGLSQSGSS